MMGGGQSAPAEGDLKLDFSKLLQLSKSGSESKTEADAQKDRPAKPIERQKSRQLYAETQKEIEREKAVSEIYREYQKNTAMTGSIQAEILKGISAGEDVYMLFLKAVKAISIMTHNDYFYSQVEKDGLRMYGKICGNATPLKMQLEETERRLERLNVAVEEEPDPQEKDRLRRSVTAHEERIRMLQEQIKQS